MGTTKQNSSMLASWGLSFSYPKPVFLIEYLVSIFTRPEGEEVVLDFFAGSGTTAHAVMSANARDGGDRRYILVQMAEPTQGGTIADLARRRVVSAGQALRTDLARRGSTVSMDFGFRSLKADSTNMRDVLRIPDEAEQGQLDLSIDSVKPDRNAEDLLFQVLLDWGLELTLPISVEQIDGHEVFIVDDGALMACFDKQVHLDAVREIAKREPLRAVFLDAGFDTDAARINAEQIFREVSPSTDVKTI